MKNLNLTNLCNQVIRRGSGERKFLFRYAAMVFVLLMVSMSSAWAGTTTKKYYYYAKVTATSTGNGYVYASTTSATQDQATSTSLSCGPVQDNNSYSSLPANGQVTFYLSAKPQNNNYKFDGWSESSTRPSSFLSTSETYTYPVSIPAATSSSSNPGGTANATTSESNMSGDVTYYYSNTVTKTLYAYFSEKKLVNITFIGTETGSYKSTISGVTNTVSSSGANANNVEEVLLSEPIPANGYVFAGWYQINTSGTILDISNDLSKSVNFSESGNVSIGARFVSTSTPKFRNISTSTEYYGLKAALSAAVSGETIIPVAEETVLDGADLLPADNGTYTIPAGVTLLVPYNTSNSVQTKPVKINETKNATAITIYKKLKFTEGVNIVCNGTICVGGQALAGNGGNPSGYVTGACGFIDMSAGGHIELNNGSTLYCWGFIKGQDMDQGNNTQDVGTITANSGSTIWEDFATGDWRGGTFTGSIAMGSSRFFPFQSYFIQNIEIPVTYKYGSTLKNFFTFNMSSQAQETDFDVIGSGAALFKLTDANSLVRKWYDPTTDLMCYELSGTAIIDHIELTVSSYPVNSEDFDLPINSNMQIILTKCTLTLNKPMLIQPGAVVEIKPDANVTIATKIYLYDKDEWGEWISSKYYRSYGGDYPILTSHKNRGNGSSNKDMDDAIFMVDGTLTVSSGGLYSSTGGANVMGNDGGEVIFSASLPSAGSVKWYKSTKTSGDGELGTTTMTAANLCNEDGFYTKSAKNTFHNVHGRWFVDGKQNEKTDHTYDFTYMAGENIGEENENRNTGADVNTDAVYSNDKTGMEARMKWFNVTSDCSGEDEDHVMHYWWKDANDYFYNWTMLSAWHQFIPTETEGLYSGSNNKLYTKTDVSTACTWSELGETDVNCLYTIEDTKKALVDGHFIALEPNSDDAAFHEAADPTKYYICFEGCNWHEATKIEGEKKAYAINEDNFIWYEDRWMQAEREIPFFYTYDETNVKVYYEYIGSEWVLAQPYVEVKDALETRQLLTFSEALTVASAKKNATIKILRDIPNVVTSGVYTGVGQTCTLDLNGHIVTSSCQNLLTVNAKSGTLTILDNTTDKKGELRACPFANARTTGFTVTAGTLVLQSGKMYSTNSATRTGSTAATYKDATNTGIVVAGTFNVTGGILESEDENQNYGAQVSGTVNLSAGKIIAKTTKWYSTRGVYLAYGKLNISGTGALEVTAAGSDAVYGVYVHATASYNASKNTTSKSAGTLTMTGGSISAQSGKNAYAVYVNRAVAVASTTDRTIKADALGVMTMSGGTIEAVATSSTNARGVYSYGTVTISGGSITATAKANTTAYGILTYHGVTTIKGTANIMANATGTAYGVLASGDINGTYGYLHKSDVKIENGTIKANATTGNTAYAVYVTGTTKTVANAESAAQKVFNGDYAAAGSATITTGAFEANAKGTTAAGIFVNSEAAVTKGDASDIPTCTVNGGYYKMTGSSAVTGCNNAAAPANFRINGGYYSHDGNLATYAVSPKHVLTLAAGDANRPPFYYKVAEAYQVTFKNEDGTANIIDPIYQEVNTKPVCSTEPTKASTSTNSFTFDGWATAANGDKVYEKNGLPNVTSAGATYYAHFATTTLKYRVHFDAATNGGDCATENIYVNPGAAVGTLPTATKYGYTFSGWFTAASGGTKLKAKTVINANADYYAQFTVNSHALTWNLAGGKVSTAGKIGSTTWPAANATGTPSTSVAYGTVLTTIPVVTKTGYVFNRWDPVPTSSMPDNDVTYTALWNPATNTKYYVKHYQQNIDDDNYTLVETDNLTGTTDATVTPARKSYDGFLTPGPQQLTIGAAGTTELAYYYDRVVYTINWNASANGGACATTSTDVRHGANIALPAATKTGHIFDGWYTKAEGGNKISEGATILQNYGTLYAQYSINKYKVTFDSNGGSAVSTIEQNYNTAVTAPADPTREGYTFNGWSPAVPSVMPASNTNCVAQWTINKYKVTFDSNGGSAVSTIEQNYNTAVTAPTDPTREGYTFAGWSPSVPSVMPASNTNCVAQWTVNPYTITFDSNGGSSVASITQNYGTAVTAPANPTREGYTFNGWSPAVPSTMPVNGLTCVAQWTVNPYTITFDSNGGSSVASITQNYGTAVTAPADPTREGYTFNGWSPAVPSVMPASNTNCVAQWTVNPYTITFDSNGGSSVASITQNYGTAVTAPADPTREGYTFNGWSPAVPSTMPVNGLTCVAQWTVNPYTITFDSNGGSSVASITQNYGTAVTAPADPTREGYTFNGWSPAVPSTMPVNGLTCVAQWTINQCLLTVLANNDTYGTVTGSGKYDYNTPHTITATPNTGFKFVKWNDESTDNPRTVTVTADVTYTATFDYDIANYTVKHWQQNINNDEYTEVTGDQQDIPGTIGEQTAAVAKNYTGFTAQPFSQETIALNNTVVNIYYNRNTYLIKWIVMLNLEQEAYKEETLRYGAMPSYGEDPTKEQSDREVYTFSGWTPEPYTVNKDQTYTGSFNVAPRPYTIRFVNDNGSELQSSQVGWGSTPTYKGENNPVSSHTGDEYEYTFVGWTPEIKEVDGEAIYTATYSRSAEAITVNTHETVTNNTTASSTTVEEGGALTIGDGETPTSVNTNTTIVEDGGQLIVASGSSLGESDPDEESTIIVESGGQLDVAADGSIQADVFIIQATTEETGDDDALEEIQVSGELSETGTQNLQTVYYDLTRKHGTEKFLARVWYAVAVPWAVEVPNYANGGVFIKCGENFVPQRLGATFDLISYDGNCRAQNGAGANCWVYLEDEPEYVMVPGKLYMIYLTEETYTIRFKKADNRPIHTNTLTVSAYNETSNANDANWNGIANPATYNAYMNVSANGLVQKFVPGTQPRDGGSYLSLDLTDKQAVGQPFFVQVDPTAGTSVVVTRNNTPTLAPRRAQAEGDKEVRYAIGIAANGKLTDRLYIQTAEEKEDKYVIGKDMSKMGVSSYVAQMWIERFNSKLCLNTMMLTNSKASYPLGIYAPQAGDYMIFAPANMESGDNIYLTYDGRVIWNLTIAPYYASLEQGTITRYGLRLVRSNAPAVSTGVDEVQSENAQCTKVIMDDQVYILRGEELYTITGQKAK